MTDSGECELFMETANDAEPPSTQLTKYKEWRMRMSKETKMQVFENNEFGKLNILMINDRPYFPATECAKILGYSNPRDAVLRHCKGVVKRDVVSNTTNQHGTTTEQVVGKSFIPEGDLYRLIARSKLPSAEKFEKWVFDDVLPTIRKTGGYVANDELFIDTYFSEVDDASKDVLRASLASIRALKNKLGDQERTIAEQQQAIADMEPKADYYDLVLQTKNAVPISLIAKDYGMSANKMNSLLNEIGVQYKLRGTWLLYSKYQGNGYTKSKTYFCNGVSNLQTNWTQKGRLFIYERLKKRGILPVIEQN